MKKIGILAGTFDPVHIGHIAFAREATKKFDLEKIVLLPERLPRYKQTDAKFRDRLKMLELAIGDDGALEIYDTRERRFSLVKSMPKLQSKYPNSELVFLVGSDVARKLSDWENIGVFPKDGSWENIYFLVAVRSGHDEASLKKEVLDALPSLKLSFMLAPQSGSSSRRIREDKDKAGIAAVDNYIAEHHIYG